MRTHPLNIGYLVVGLVFLGLAGSWALTEAGVVDAGGIRWALPVTLVAAGAAGLLASAVRAVRGGGAERLPGPPGAGLDPDRLDEPESTYSYDDPAGPTGAADPGWTTVTSADRTTGHTTGRDTLGDADPTSEPDTLGDPRTADTQPDTSETKDETR